MRVSVALQQSMQQLVAACGALPSAQGGGGGTSAWWRPGAACLSCCPCRACEGALCRQVAFGCPLRTLEHTV